MPAMDGWSVTSDWQEQQTRTDAQAVAHERLEAYQRERDERMAGYRLTWERIFARQRLAAAHGRVQSLWMVK